MISRLMKLFGRIKCQRCQKWTKPVLLSSFCVPCNRVVVEEHIASLYCWQETIHRINEVAIPGAFVKRHKELEH